MTFVHYFLFFNDRHINITELLSTFDEAEISVFGTVNNRLTRNFAYNVYAYAKCKKMLFKIIIVLHFTTSYDLNQDV